MLAFTLAITAVTGALFGLVPARQMLNPDISSTLRENGRGGQRGARHRARRVLVVAEVALSVMLLAGAGLLIRSFTRLMNVDPGFRTDHLMSFALALPEAKYEKPTRQGAMIDAVMERIRSIPGVQSAGAGQGLPLTGYGFSLSFSIAGRPPLRPSEEPDAELRITTPEYLSTLGVRITRGR